MLAHYNTSVIWEMKHIINDVFVNKNACHDPDVSKKKGIIYNCNYSNNPESGFIYSYI